MNKQWTLGALAAVILGVLVALGAFAGPRPSDSGTVSNTEDMAMRAVIADFGSRLKNVSLLAPDASAQIAAQYGTYITPELLATWQAKPEGAPGRQTSSPWPDRIEVTSIEQIGEGDVYHVGANVVEVTNGSVPNTFAAMYPVSIEIEEHDGKWLIAGWHKEAMHEQRERITVVGYWECLPKKGDGPHTMECAFGIAIDQSDGHYAINTSLMSTYPVDYPTGQKVRVSGVVQPAPVGTSYDIDGVLWATTIEKL